MKHEAHHGNGKMHTISDALSLLNNAADESADEIRGMMKTDYKKLKRIFADAKPEVRAALSEIRMATADKVESVDKSVHENAWRYLGLTAGLAAIVGFLLGRKTCSR